MNVKFRTIDFGEREQVKVYMKAFYAEDAEGQPMTEEKIEKTFAFLAENRSCGEIVVFECEGKTIGYAILINFWSNEYGGVILNLDEIYVDRAFRGRGIAKDFIRFLVGNKHNNSVAMQLQVFPSNEKAYQLYNKIGFKQDKNRFMFYQY